MKEKGRRMLLSLHLCTLLLACAEVARCQRYAERNVLPAPSPPDASYDANGDYYNEDYYEEGTYGFRDEDIEKDIFKWTVEQYPHPVNTPKFCNRFKPSHVCDPDLVLEKEQADLLDEYIRKLYRETACICESCEGEDKGGIVVGIALLKHLYHPYHMHHAKVIRSFAQDLRVKWNLGSCDNDILIVVATTDRLSYTDVGRTTSDYLSLHEAHRIFLENKAKFSASNFSEGLMDILQGYHRATRGIERSRQSQDSNTGTFVVAGAIVGSILILGAILFLGFVVYRRCKGKDTDEVEPKKGGAGTTVSSSWSKKDIKVLFGPEKSGSKRASSKYQKCGTDENDAGTGRSHQDEDPMDFTLASPDDVSFREDQTQLTDVTSESAKLEEDLVTAAEGLVKTFPTTGQRGNVLMTDM